MPLYANKSQPYFLDPESPNRIDCVGEYCYPVNAGDVVHWQGFQTPCGVSLVEDPEFGDFTLGAELISNGSFMGSAAGWVLGAGWSWVPDQVDHFGFANDLSQTPLGLVVGTFYEVSFDFTRTSGSLKVVFGNGVEETSSQIFDTTGTQTFSLVFLDTVTDIIRFVPTGSGANIFSVDNVSVKEITYTSWNPNGAWQLGDGLACHVDGQVGDLEETVANYILTALYYQVYFTLSGVVQGSVEVFASDISLGTFTSDGIYTKYATPLVDGVLKFTPSSDFIGCVSLPKVFLLSNSYVAILADANGNNYDVSDSVTYYEDWVTLALNFQEREFDYGCYTLELLDSCLVNGANLVTNPNFTNQGDDWSGYQYTDYSANTMRVYFDPLNGPNVGPDLIVNGDFGTGDFTGWTAGAGWSVVGNKARHTPGNTATLSQSVTITIPPAPTVSHKWVRFTISNRTAGSITLTLSNDTTVSFTQNAVILMRFFNLSIDGLVTFSINPSSDFDGDIDDISLNEVGTIWAGGGTNYNIQNTLMAAGNYEMEFEIISTTALGAIVGIGIQGMTQPVQYFSAVGVHTVSLPNYVPGTQIPYLSIAFVADGAYYVAGEIVIDNVVVRRVEPFDATYTSQCLNYQNVHQNTKMIKAWCDQQALGFEFTNTGYYLQQRCRLRSMNPQYPNRTLIAKSGTGDSRLNYSEFETYWIMALDYMDESAHTAMAAMLSCDHLLIGDGNPIEYTSDGEEYTPQWVDTYSLAPARVRVREKENGQLFNRHL